MHWPEPDEDIEEGWTTLVELKKQGKVREIGVSNHNVKQLERLQAIHPVASLQPPYSMLRREIEAELVPFCERNNIGIICYSPMGKGLLTGKFTLERARSLSEKDHRSRDPQFQSPQIEAALGLVECLAPIAAKHGKSLAELSIAWVLRLPAVTAAIVGSRSPTQVRETSGVGDWSIPDEDIETINQLLHGYSQALRHAGNIAN